MLWCKTIIYVHTDTTQLRSQQPTLQLLVLQSADAEPTTMQHHNKWTSTSWRLLRTMNSAGDFSTVSHLDLLIVFGNAFDLGANLGCHCLFCIYDPVAHALYVRELAQIGGVPSHLCFHSLGTVLAELMKSG